MKQPLQDELKRLEELGIIVQEHQPTDWLSAIVTVQKANGKLRVCIDPKPLNKVLKRAHYPFPVLEDILPDCLKLESSALSTWQAGFGMLSWMSHQVSWQPSLHPLETSDGNVYLLALQRHQSCSRCASMQRLTSSKGLHPLLMTSSYGEKEKQMRKQRMTMIVIYRLFWRDAGKRTLNWTQRSCSSALKKSHTLATVFRKRDCLVTQPRCQQSMTCRPQQTSSRCRGFWGWWITWASFCQSFRTPASHFGICFKMETCGTGESTKKRPSRISNGRSSTHQCWSSSTQHSQQLFSVMPQAQGSGQFCFSKNSPSHMPAGPWRQQSRDTLK